MITSLQRSYRFIQYRVIKSTVLQLRRVPLNLPSAPSSISYKTYCVQ